MNTPKPLTFRNFLLAISSVLIVWLPVLFLHLVVPLFTALITFAATRAIGDKLQSRLPNWRHSTGLGLLIFLVCLSLVLWFTGEWLGDKANSHTLPQLMDQMAVILDQLHDKLPDSISKHIPASVQEIREVATGALRAHVAQLQTAGVHTLHSIGYAIMGIVIGGIAVMQVPPLNTNAPSKSLAQVVHTHFDELMAGFTNVFFAQVRISAINTILTAVYLVGILPLAGHPLPMTGTLIVVTFILGLIPVLGNLLSNSVIAVISLSDGLMVAGMSLAWLITIHKLEYFLNAHIIGHKIHAAAWEILIMMLLFEAAFGVPGIVSAPVIYAQTKRLLAKEGWV